ncbi:conserved hypothetical protein [Gammaproteobacteria bacterium]
MNIPTEDYASWSLALSPSGSIHIDASISNQERLLQTTAKLIEQQFAKSSACGLLYLSIASFSNALPPSFAFWQKFSRQFILQICRVSGAVNTFDSSNIPTPSAEALQDIIEHAPIMVGVEYLNLEVLGNLWQKLITALNLELQRYDGNLQNYLSAYNSAWNLVGRVCFHLAENKNNLDLPFAFLATYTDKLLATSGVRHLPLGNALQEYAGEKNRSALLALLLPVQKAAAQSSFVSGLLEKKEIFHPLAWSPRDAYKFLHDIPAIESAGIVVRVPNWWNPAKPSRPKVAISIGQSETSTVGMGALLDFNMQIALSSGENLTTAEIAQLLNSSDGLVKIKGQWVEVDKQKLTEVLEHWKLIQKQVNKNGLSFAEGLRLLAGVPTNNSENEASIASATEWSYVTAGDWLLNTLNKLRSPDSLAEKQITTVLNQYLYATLRPYQVAGVKWLWLLYNLKLGGCLADDMGLGKTIQILALILLIKYCAPKSSPHLLVVPASLLANWQSEILRFTPSINFLIIHSSAANDKDLKNFSQDSLRNYDLVITTYGFAQRLEWIKAIDWDIVVLDEAQTIKNPNTKQTRAVKSLKSNIRFILSGTPIENHLMDLWSLFDFTAPGLLGTSKVFLQHSKKLNDSIKTNFLVAIRSLVKPYILRRLKSDKNIIADLPDKTELKNFCNLTKAQVVLYQQTVEELTKTLQEETEGIKRRGLILAYILRFKQICNHPAQLLGHGAYVHSESGKFLRIKELCEEIAAKQEKVLIFTQFREIIPAISDFLTEIFGTSGLELHGGVLVKQRAKLVAAFQQEQGPPFFVLSLKAGGTGLNLTNAAHVIHFDRWWNPAVENQATDRAYRIGQKKNVLVHKFICRGTIEEKIDELIEAKKSLSNEMLSGGAESLLTEMSNEELMRVVALDVNRALADE